MIASLRSPDLCSNASRRASSTSPHHTNRTTQPISESMYSPPDPASTESTPCRVLNTHSTTTNTVPPSNFINNTEKDDKCEGQRTALYPRRGSCQRNGGFNNCSSSNSNSGGVGVGVRRESMSSPFVESEHEFDYVLGVVNPASGECDAAQFVLRSMRMLLGGDRVVILDGALFADPTPLHEAIRNHAVRFIREGSSKKGDTTTYTNGISSSTNNNNNNDNNSNNNNIRSSRSVLNGVEKRGTIIVSGGDGTVSFIMEQLDVVRDLIEQNIATSKECNPDNTELHNNNNNNNNSDRDRGMRFVLPAVAVLALGTGNDYSNCVGFGGGYTQYKASGLCCCVENPIEPLIKDAISAPAVPFDRWMARLAPLSSVWEQQREREREKKQKQLQKRKKIIKKDKEEEKEGTEEVLLRHSTRGVASVVQETKLDAYAIDWDALVRSGKCLNYHFINYFSIGFDAYVLQKFDTFRRKHPSFCRTRWNNKLVYGVYGLKAAFRCGPLRSSIPAICVPTMPEKTHQTRHENTLIERRSVEEEREDEREREGDIERTNIITSTTTNNNNNSNSNNNNSNSNRMATLTLPHGSKTLLVTNVNSYAAGTRPWKEKKGELYRDTPNTNPMLITPVSVNDHKMELQAIDGFFQMGMLQLGLGSGASKLAQSRELYMFILCKPTDITRRPSTQDHEEYEEISVEEDNINGRGRGRKGKGKGKGKNNRNNGNNGKEKECDMTAEVLSNSQTPLSVQIDGEAVLRIGRPTIVHITELQRPRVYVRCRNPKVVRHTLYEEDDDDDVRENGRSNSNSNNINNNNNNNNSNNINGNNNNNNNNNNKSNGDGR